MEKTSSAQARGRVEGGRASKPLIQAIPEVISPPAKML